MFAPPDDATLKQQTRRLYALLPALRDLLLLRGVRRADVDDVAQDVLFGAWRGLRDGRFCAPSHTNLDDALARWLYGVAWRHVTHYRESAWQRRIVPTADPHRFAQELAPSAEARVGARESLQAIERIPEWARDVLILRYAEEYAPKEISEELGVGINTIYNRLRLARQHVERASQRWRGR